MASFPVEKLVPLPGVMSGTRGDVAITIPIRPFELMVDGELLLIETEFRLEAVDLPSSNLKKLSGKTFEFPDSSEDGCVDASIYIQHAHHPVDVRTIRFGKFSSSGTIVELDTEIALEFEGLDEFSNAPWSFAAVLVVAD